MRSTTRERRRPGYHAIITTSPACTGTNTGRTRSPDFGLLASVVEHQKIFFREAAARYDLAKPGSLRVCPPDDKLVRTRSDYRDMREMFFVEPPPFNRLMADLRELEDRVNR